MKVKYLITLSFCCLLYFALIYLVYVLKIRHEVIRATIELLTIPTMVLTVSCAIYGTILLAMKKVKGIERVKLFSTTLLLAVLSTFFLLDLFSPS